MKTEKKWYAISLNDHWERKVTETLLRKKIGLYCPRTIIKTRQEEKKNNQVRQPLFGQLLFVHLDEAEIMVVKQIEGVQHFLYWHGDYAIIGEEDIEAIRIFLDLYVNVRVEKATVGFSTSLVETMNDTAPHKKVEQILLPTLGYFLVAEIYVQSEIEPVNSKRLAGSRYS